MLKTRTLARRKQVPIYAATRQQQILKLVNQDASVTVDHLADLFGVSKASIRRDLRALRDLGTLRRTYGGAVKKTSISQEASFSERQVANYEEKQRIGEEAARHILPGMTVFVDGGTTTECMVPFLLDKRITVITYGLNILTRLAGAEDITLVSIGGTLNHRSMTFGGVLALDSIQAYSMRFDLAFIACGAVSADAGVANASFESIPMKRKATEAAQRAIVLADSSKVGCIATAMIAPVTKYERLITGREALPEEVDTLRRLGLVVDLV